METGLLHLHNILRWVIFILLLIGIFKNYADANKPFTKAHKNIGLFTMIAAHLTLLIGLYQVILGNRFSWTNVPAGESVMKNSTLRFFLVEHPLAMIIAIVLITIGYGVYKKNISDTQKHKKAALMFLLALVLILAVVPWPFRADGIARPLFPGM
ncbi:hypothetical protein ACFSPU_03605 [Haoranjiania flava]|uniref:Cytochrome B n=1 Tax=Haoranjiania flava TaxID=1856322 RepID=A0AAE3LK53_9BACT|nr:hypothetical protein [Haoranjiania flava]MCU7694467.1 hypothetical protein [Haoranjiania flava]